MSRVVCQEQRIATNHTNHGQLKATDSVIFVEMSFLKTIEQYARKKGQLKALRQEDLFT